MMGAMARCIVTRKLPFDALERLRAEHEVEFWRGALPPTPAELRELAGRRRGDPLDADRLRSTGELIDACPDLRAVANFAVGTDNVDVAYAARTRDRRRQHSRRRSPRRPPTSPSR